MRSLPCMFRRIIFLAWLLLTDIAKAELVVQLDYFAATRLGQRAIIAEARPQPADSGPAPCAARRCCILVYVCGLRGTRVALLL